MYEYAGTKRKKMGHDSPLLPKSPVNKTSPPNLTGIPDAMKSKYEELSGFSFQDVRVHYNSNLPEQLHALAYTQGSQVFIGPGQEKNLEHELGHVIQQKQGRVMATHRFMGRKVNVDKQLEKEANHVPTQMAGGNGIQGNMDGGNMQNDNDGFVCQMKMKFSDVEEPVEFVVDNTGDPKEIREEVLMDKPNQIKERVKKDPCLADTFNKEKLKNLATKWDTEVEDDFSYTKDEKGVRKAAKDSLKHYLNKEFNWRSVGAAAYMTGDATGLAIAPTVDPLLSVKVLAGQQVKDRTTVSAPSFLIDGKLPSYFKQAIESGQVIISNTDGKAYGGTADRYRKKYNIHTGGGKKPWNKETWEATKIIGTAYRSQAETIKSQMQLGPDDVGRKFQIENYKKNVLDKFLGGRPCIVLWGRNSGASNGAHKELDSHPQMVIQIRDFIRERFPDRAILFVGDKVITHEEFKIEDHAYFIGQFWKEEVSGEYAESLKERNAQRYLFQLLAKENKAISIGMRSGSLEGMALLNLPVIFLDDDGNNAEGRMEFWSGTAAKYRSLVPRGIKEVWERLMEGPIPNYKRLTTALKMGNEVETRKIALSKWKSQFIKLITAKDYEGKLVCDGYGNEKGNHLMQVSLEQLKKPWNMKKIFEIFEKVHNSFSESPYKGGPPKIHNNVSYPKPVFKYKVDDMQRLIDMTEELAGMVLLQKEELDNLEFLIKRFSDSKADDF